MLHIASIVRVEHLKRDHQPTPPLSLLAMQLHLDASEQRYAGAARLHASCRGVISGFGQRTLALGIDAARLMSTGGGATLHHDDGLPLGVTQGGIGHAAQSGEAGATMRRIVGLARGGDALGGSTSDALGGPLGPWVSSRCIPRELAAHILRLEGQGEGAGDDATERSVS
jgi:hypothetical protein